METIAARKLLNSSLFFLFISVQSPISLWCRQKLDRKIIQEIALLKKKDRSLICCRLNMWKTVCKPNSNKTSPFLNANHFSCSHTELILAFKSNIYINIYFTNKCICIPYSYKNTTPPRYIYGFNILLCIVVAKYIKEKLIKHKLRIEP